MCKGLNVKHGGMREGSTNVAVYIGLTRKIRVSSESSEHRIPSVFNPLDIPFSTVPVPQSRHARLIERIDTHPESTYPLLKRLGGAMAVAKFRLQLDAYWREKAPFDRAKPVRDGDVLGWWRQFTDNPEADVLAVCRSPSRSLAFY